MKPQVNIIVLVDVVGALSERTLNDGNLSLVDDGQFDSPGQGTTRLCTVVSPGQLVQWTAVAVDVQTPVEIRSITFLGSGDAALEEPDAADAQDVPAHEGTAPDLKVWSGFVPPYLVPGAPYRYRLELQMHEGPNSVLHVDSPALMSA
ncbi:hypothetical protein AGRA3207_000887 [Actinomadura graeca]|uniref:Inclusion body protein n=1 Tax=Actinomadura graeca TaxID=2750812 RepID=A0ABX8QQK0_9ACTN|nr:hypothetical protein [Actinomadura graeca]QXJ20214.1 hypothetical protein AGRA3207_000887 [Actinomadura graeca]